jgi:hypothetical protein
MSFIRDKTEGSGRRVPCRPLEASGTPLTVLAVLAFFTVLTILTVLSILTILPIFPGISWGAFEAHARSPVIVQAFRSVDVPADYINVEVVGTTKIVGRGGSPVQEGITIPTVLPVLTVLTVLAVLTVTSVLSILSILTGITGITGISVMTGGTRSLGPNRSNVKLTGNRIKA